jgi:ethanolamine ammonia-lyase small subunit
MTKINYNGVLRDMTPEEETARENDIAQDLAKEEAEAQAKLDAQAEKEATDALKASAKAKLIAGEALTEEEANTIVL